MEKDDWEMVCHVIEIKDLRSQPWVRSKTMKIEGKLEGVPILLLVDSGASHNYIARELVTSLNLPISRIREFSVTLGDGSKRASKGLCEGLKVSIGENYLHVNVFILEIGGIDMILEMEWLETLGEVKSN